MAKLNLPNVNLRIIRRTRPSIQEGTLFAFQVPDGRYGRGMVLRKNSPHDGSAPMPAADLLVFFDALYEDLFLSSEGISGCSALFPPVWTNRMGWSRGYFVAIGEAEIPEPFLPENSCFYDIGRKRHFDGYGRATSKKPLCGTWALFSYRWIDDQISDALGYARVPTEEAQ